MTKISPITIQFEKMHGNGNDFIFIDKQVLNNFHSSQKLRQMAMDMCHRNFAVGADGVVFYDAPGHKLAIINADGSFAATCGNALRCYALKLLQQKLWAGKSHLQIKRLVPLYLSKTDLDPSETFMIDESGVFATLIEGELEKKRVSVAMGLESAARVVKIPDNSYHIIQAVFVQLANPHLVFISPSFSTFDDDDLSEFGKWAQGELLQSFAGKIPVCNIGMLSLQDKADKYALTVYERGVGLTLCCGSGAVAARVALEALGLVKQEWLARGQGFISFQLPGGIVDIGSTNIENVLQRVLVGSAELVYRGAWEWC